MHQATMYVTFFAMVDRASGWVTSTMVRGQCTIVLEWSILDYGAMDHPMVLCNTFAAVYYMLCYKLHTYHVNSNVRGLVVQSGKQSFIHSSNFLLISFSGDSTAEDAWLASVEGGTGQTILCYSTVLWWEWRTNQPGSVYIIVTTWSPYGMQNSSTGT